MVYISRQKILGCEYFCLFAGPLEFFASPSLPLHFVEREARRQISDHLLHQQICSISMLSNYSKVEVVDLTAGIAMQRRSFSIGGE